MLLEKDSERGQVRTPAQAEISDQVKIVFPGIIFIMIIIIHIGRSVIEQKLVFFFQVFRSETELVPGIELLFGIVFGFVVVVRILF